MALHTWLIYVIAVTGLSLTPGPNGLLALTHGAMYGHRMTLYTITGGVAGFAVLMALSMFGVGALLETSAHALTVLKWAGGAYLIWLGIQLWRAPALQLAPVGQAGRQRGSVLFRQGLLSAMTNPKVLLFYGAFLPQFIDPQRPLGMQFAIMAATLTLIEFVVEYLLARLAFRIRPWLEQGGTRFNRFFGGVFAVIGMALPITR